MGEYYRETQYKTGDGKVFDSYVDAMFHQRDMERQEQEKAEADANYERDSQLLQAASACLEKGDRQGALKYYSQLSSRMSMWFNCGVTYLQMGNYDKAIELLKKVSDNGAGSIDRHFALSQVALAEAYFKKGNVDQAVVTYKAAYKNGMWTLNSDAVYIADNHLKKIAAKFEKEKKWDDALEIYDILRQREDDEYDPEYKEYSKKEYFSFSSIEAWFLFADVYAKAGDEEQAIIQYKAVADIAYEANLKYENKEVKKLESSALAKLAKQGVQYTPVVKEEYFAAVRNGDKNALEIVEMRGWDDLYQKYKDDIKAQRLAPLKKFFAFPPMTGKYILGGLGLGAVCGFLSIIAISVIITMITKDSEYGLAKPVLWMIAVAVVFLYFWLKRKWLGIVLILALGIFGGYTLFDPISIGAKTEKTMNVTTATVTANSLNLRAEPSTKGTVVAKLKKGDTLVATGKEENGWIKVKYNDKEGYVDTNYITVNR